MLKKTALFFTLALSCSSAFSFTPEQLSKMEVSQLDLLVSNLNVILASDLDQEKPDTVLGTVRVFSRFSLSNSNQLMFDSVHTAPFTDVTKKKCDELAADATDFLTSDSFSNILRMLSHVSISGEELKPFLQSTYIYISITADENKDLRLTCTNQ